MTVNYYENDYVLVPFHSVIFLNFSTSQVVYLGLDSNNPTTGGLATGNLDPEGMQIFTDLYKTWLKGM